MAGYFIDTSALAKLYHREPGSDYVERVLSQHGSKGIISRLSLVELESVLAIKVRTGVLDAAGQMVAQHLLGSTALRRGRNLRMFSGGPGKPQLGS